MGWVLLAAAAVSSALSTRIDAQHAGGRRIPLWSTRPRKHSSSVAWSAASIGCAAAGATYLREDLPIGWVFAVIITVLLIPFLVVAAHHNRAVSTR